MDFAGVLKKLRTDKNMSQADLAKKLGVSKSRISMYELGEREPDFETLELIADYFNVDMGYLLGDKGVSTYVMTPEEKAIAEAISDDAELLAIMQKLNNAQYRKKLLKWMELMELYDKETNDD